MINRGILEIPPNARSIIIFAHGPGKSCLSPRNRLVARSLLHRGFAVLLPDLSDRNEDSHHSASPQNQEYINRIADRLTSMIAAANRPDAVHAVISRGGRPDLAEDFLGQVLAPTLMIVGGKDHAHIDHNRHASARMRDKPMLELVQGANHLFSEPGMIEKVASMSLLWYQRNLALRACSPAGSL
jgi:putative phosphoribosyl transferase